MSILDGGGVPAVVLETAGARATTVLTGTCPNTTGEGAVDTFGEGTTDALGEPVAGFLAAVSGIAGWSDRTRCGTPGLATSRGGKPGAIATRSPP